MGEATAKEKGFVGLSLGGNNIMPIYRCHGEGCSYATDDLGKFVQHVLNERLPKALASAEPKKVVKGHRTLREYLSCPECYAKIEKELLARGWRNTKQEEEAEKARRKSWALPW